MNPRARNIVFSLLPTLGVIALLALTEFTLRTIWPNPAARAVLDLEFDGRAWYQVNRAHLSKYFPPGAPAVPEFKPSLFFQERPRGLFRVICLGGSSMFGTPYIMSGTVPAVVRNQLRDLMPDREVEVINWAATAINSNVVRDLADDLAAFDPDLVLIYMGHNEFYGPDGVGASALERWMPALTRLKYDVREFRLIQVLQDLLAGTPERSGEINLMRQVSGAALVEFDSDESRRILALFEDNLRAVLQTFRARSVPVILSDVSSNLLFPPFVSDSTVGSVTALALTRAEGLVRADSMDGAMRALASVPDEDSLAAAVQYWKGRALLGLGFDARARQHLVVARDQDLLKFRAPSPVNQTIRKVAGEEGVRCVSSDSLLAAMSGGIPNDAVFWEHLHLTAEGYAAVARLFVEAAQSEGLVPQGALLPFDVDSLAIAWLDRAYADLSIRQLTGRWPFKDYERTGAVFEQAAEPLQEIARATYARELPWDEGCYRSATYFWARGRFRDARTTYEALLSEYPYGFYPNYLMGSLLNHMGKTQDAIHYYRQSVRSNPAFPRARLDLALIGINAGRVDEGIRELSAVLDLLPSSGQEETRATVYYGLAAAHANRGDLNRALSYVDQALTLAPGYREAVRLRSQIIAAAER